nr:branched-chain amino acid ABC transporter permease [Chloroflexia bacterium]
LGSISGSALAAVIIGLAQQFGNYYTSWAGDFVIVLLLAVVLLLRPNGLLGGRT